MRRVERHRDGGVVGTRLWASQEALTKAMTFAGGKIREVKPLSFIYEAAQALPADVCLEAPEVKRSTDLRISRAGGLARHRPDPLPLALAILLYAG